MQDGEPDYIPLVIIVILIIINDNLYSALCTQRASTALSKRYELASATA